LLIPTPWANRVCENISTKMLDAMHLKGDKEVILFNFTVNRKNRF
jgi:hypothetical protein